MTKTMSMRRQFRFSFPPLQSSQWGWLCSTSFHVTHLGQHREVQWSDVRQIVSDQHKVVVVSRDHSTLTIPREHFLEDDWLKIDRWRQSLPRDLV